MGIIFSFFYPSKVIFHLRGLFHKGIVHLNNNSLQLFWIQEQVSQFIEFRVFVFLVSFIQQLKFFNAVGSKVANLLAQPTPSKQMPAATQKT